MNDHEISRRDLLKGSAALAGLVALGFPLEALEVATAAGEVIVPWLDQPPPFPAPPEQTGVDTVLVWEEVGDLLTWSHKFFTVQHYGKWPVIPEASWRLAVSGLVGQPLALTLAQLRARPRQEVTFTLECSGNHGFPFFTGGIGTAHWAGTPLAPLLRAAGAQGTEVVFWGSDAGPGPVGDQTVTCLLYTSPSPRDS